MAKHTTAKYRKAMKNTKAKRKADKEQTRTVTRQRHLNHTRRMLEADTAKTELAVQQPELGDNELPEAAPGAIERIVEATKPDDKPISPARRAFQDK